MYLKDMITQKVAKWSQVPQIWAMNKHDKPLQGLEQGVANIIVLTRKYHRWSKRLCINPERGTKKT
jgi:hypothetical protein